MAECVSFAQGIRMRATRLDACGRPATGEGFDTDCVQVVSDGFVSVAASPNVESGTDIVQTNANGKLCINARSPDQFRNFDLEQTFCEVDVDLFAMITNSRPVTGYDGETIGFDTLEGAADQAYALEVWVGVPSQPCPATGSAETVLGYALYPWVIGGVIGSYTIQNDAVTFTTTGFTKGGSIWGVGPYDVQLDAGTPAPLSEPVGTDVHGRLIVTNLAAPDAECGCTGIAA